LTHEFVRAIVEDRHAAVDIWEAIAYTLPGIVAHQSALKGGERMKIRDYGRAPGPGPAAHSGVLQNVGRRAERLS
jgi:hypothetical protein